jgi:hypothetical protein
LARLKRVGKVGGGGEMAKDAEGLMTLKEKFGGETDDVRLVSRFIPVLHTCPGFSSFRLPRLRTY